LIRRSQSLYNERKMTSKEETLRKMNVIFDSAALYLKMLFVLTISSGGDKIILSAGVNESVEMLREFMLAFNKVVQRDDETRAFFIPLLNEILEGEPAIRIP